MWRPPLYIVWPGPGRGTSRTQGLTLRPGLGGSPSRPRLRPRRFHAVAQGGGRRSRVVRGGWVGQDTLRRLRRRGVFLFRGCLPRRRAPAFLPCGSGLRGSLSGAVSLLPAPPAHETLPCAYLVTLPSRRHALHGRTRPTRTGSRRRWVRTRTVRERPAGADRGRAHPGDGTGGSA